MAGCTNETVTLGCATVNISAMFTSNVCASMCLVHLCVYAPDSANMHGMCEGRVKHMAARVTDLKVHAKSK